MKNSQSLMIILVLLSSTLTSPVLGEIGSIQLSNNHITRFPNSPALEFETTLDFNSQVINRCKIYDSNGLCLYCTRDHYLSNNLCVTIEYSRIIPNCNIYKSLTECYECDENYKASSDLKSCTNTGLIDGCKKWRDQNTCVSCGTGFFLTSGRCAVALNNCAIPADVNRCLECVAGFGIIGNSSVCSPLTQDQTNQNCAQYNSQNQCIGCRSQYALNITNRLCLPANQVDNEIDPNCAATVVSNDSYCNICRQGYFLSQRPDGSLLCETLNARDESCYIIDFSNRANCLVCMPNFEIRNKKCVALKRDLLNVIDPVGSSWILNSLIVFIFGLVFIN